MVSRQQILEVLRTDPQLWGAGQFATRQRHQFYLAAAAEIERLVLLLDRAKTAALVDVAKTAAARNDWKTAQEVLSYVEKIDNYPVLGQDQIINPDDK